MPRKYERKTQIGSFTDACMREAVNRVLSGRSIRSVAKELNLSFQTLARYVTKQRLSPNDQLRMTPNYRVKQVFTDEEELTLVSYLVTCSNMFYGLPLLECRKLAYEVAVKNNKKIPETWGVNKCAGIDWMWGFLKRHPSLSMRTPEGCSLSRATAFNKHNVKVFFNNLEDVINRCPTFADGTRIFNLDETSTTTKQKKHAKIIAEKGIKQVCKVTSAEKGTLVTTCCIVSAAGNSLPPVMVFPRVHFKEHMLNGAPPGTLGLASPSGWMNADLFYDVMKHFIKHSGSTRENPSLIIYDNHESHLSINVLNVAKENGVTILTVPPHSTNKLQPLDVGLFKPFNLAYDAAIDAWLMQHPGKPMTIYEIAFCVGSAHQKALIPSNIMAAFKKCGIFPFDRDIFTEVDFLPSSVTDRPQQDRASTTCSPTTTASSSLLHQSHDEHEEVPTTPFRMSESCTESFVTPDEIRGYPKADARKNTQKGRKRGRSIIATDTPEKKIIEARPASKGRMMAMQSTSAQHKKKATNRSLFDDEDTSDEDVFDELELRDSSDEDFWDLQADPSGFEELHRDPLVGDYVLIEFKNDKRNVYFIGNVTQRKDDENDVEVSFLRKSSKVKGKFVVPNVPDVSSVHIGDIKMILPNPKPCGGTKRQQSYYTFEIDFSLIHIQ